MRADEKQVILRRAAGHINSATRTLREAQAEFEKAQALPIDGEQLKPVAPHYRKRAVGFDITRLVLEAREYSTWLAQKCHNAGTGAASDSGEAVICALLDELGNRIERDLTR
mgnify:CR=1 FL=1